jgi:hypothetical protein
VKSPDLALGSVCISYFSNDDFRPSDPPPDELAVVSSDSALSGHALPFITTQ